MELASRAGLAALLLVLIPASALTSIIWFARRRPDTSAAGGSLLLGPTLRAWHFENMRPFEDALVRRRVPPAWLSWAQLLVGVIVGLTYARGLMFDSGLLLILAGTLDILDGRVARRTNSGSRRGAFMDSVIDRYADSIAYLGIAVYFRDSWVLWAAMLALVGGVITSYTRARAEGLGATCYVGLLQRPERYVLLGLGSVFSSLVEQLAGHPANWQPNVLLTVVIVLLAGLSNFTAVQRALHVMRQLDGPLPPGPSHG
ncbi:MAG: CDP-alcohol phosphatidyltransferase family protein [Deltaproteobacteria bacterium]|nr:CDP-alcohol phosphatidyltransferase family protein [Deltaproteobacteria bacterium]